MEKSNKHNANKLTDILLEAIVHTIPGIHDTGLLEVKDSGNDTLTLTSNFKFDEGAENWLQVECVALTTHPKIHMRISLPQEIAPKRELDALRLANHINQGSNPCAVSFKNSKFTVASCIDFDGYFNDTVIELDAPDKQIEATKNQLNSLFLVAENLCKAIPASLYSTWETLVSAYNIDRCKVIPVTSATEMSTLNGYNLEMDRCLKFGFEQRWEHFINHDMRVFLIQSTRCKSVVWITWLGYRGSCWHINQHFAAGMAKPPKNHKVIAQHLIEKYQQAWKHSIFPSQPD